VKKQKQKAQAKKAGASTHKQRLRRDVKKAKCWGLTVEIIQRLSKMFYSLLLCIIVLIQCIVLHMPNCNNTLLMV